MRYRSWHLLKANMNSVIHTRALEQSGFVKQVHVDNATQSLAQGVDSIKSICINWDKTTDVWIVLNHQNLQFLITANV